MLRPRKATTAGQRHQINIVRDDLHKGQPEKSLLMSGHLKRQGRGASGHITMRHRGAGVKKRLRILDWRRDKVGVPGLVERVEYDPSRSANIALVIYADGEKRYMIAPEGLNEGATVMSGAKAEVRTGNAMALRNIPIGTPIHNIELVRGKGAQIVRGAGTAAYIQSKDGDMVTVLLPSKEVRLIHADNFATIGRVGNVDWKNQKIGKAGRKRLMGIRPTVRGTAQHPDSHPHGGGEGRSGIGLKHPKTPWGKHALGKKTRNRRKPSSKYIVKGRRVK